jgi:hypothetical protein
MEPYVPLFSEKGQERFSCFLDDDGNHTMTMDSAISSSFPPLSFTDTDIGAFVLQLAIPAAKEVKPLKSQTDIVLPPRKYVSVRSLLDEEPDLLVSVPMDGKFLSTTLRLQAGFSAPALLMQIPRADWLDKKQGRS